ncbi:hypothetical protein Sjap_012760 [Stephania japonica]|uniref:Uncharacterized protein n=1 Tax=Stephania japonica TaxID=461633 RepID=A0AAP0NXY7_9MAGN
MGGNKSSIPMFMPVLYNLCFIEKVLNFPLRLFYVIYLNQDIQVVVRKCGKAAGSN